MPPQIVELSGFWMQLAIKKERKKETEKEKEKEKILHV